MSLLFCRMNYSVKSGRLVSLASPVRVFFFVENLPFGKKIDQCLRFPRKIAIFDRAEEEQTNEVARFPRQIIRSFVSEKKYSLVYLTPSRLEVAFFAFCLPFPFSKKQLFTCKQQRSLTVFEQNEKTCITFRVNPCRPKRITKRPPQTGGL